MKFASLALASVASAALLAACGDADAPENGDAAEQSEAAAPAVEDAVVRAPAPGQDVAVAYATFTAADEDDQLTGVTSPSADRVEIHTSQMDGDVAQMRQVDELDLPAGQAVTLSAGGDHLMLFGVNADDLGETVEMTFEFASGAETTVTADVDGVAEVESGDDGVAEDAYEGEPPADDMAPGDADEPMREDEADESGLGDPMMDEPDMPDMEEPDMEGSEDEDSDLPAPPGR